MESSFRADGYFTPTPAISESPWIRPEQWPILHRGENEQKLKG